MVAESEEPLPRFIRDFQTLPQLVAQGARAAFDELREEHPDETFFAFVLSTHDDASAVGASANSEEALEAVRKKRRVRSGSRLEEALRWSPVEWKHELVGNAAFERANGAIAKQYERLEEKDFPAFAEHVRSSMQEALALLDGDGYWGKGRARGKVTLFITIYDSASTEEVEDDSARALNPPAVYRRFKMRYALTEQARQQAEKKEQTSRESVKRLSKVEQAEHWCARLEALVGGEPPGTDFLDPAEGKLGKELALDRETDALLESLQLIGKPAVLPMVELVVRSLDRTTPPAETIRFKTLGAIGEMGQASRAIHGRLAALLINACETNRDKSRWSTTPFHVARCLHALFDGYPFPSMANNGALRNHESFVEVARDHAR